MHDPTPTRRRRTRDDRTCVWPGCDKVRRRIPDVPLDETPLCSTHLSKAAAVHTIAAQLDLEHMGIVDRVRREQTKPAAPKPPEPGWIYYLQSGGHIKIGWTSDLERRMRAYPPGSQLLAVHAGTRADEATMHRRFAVHRTHGREWYPLAADLMRHIASVTGEHGPPPAVDFAGKPAEIPRPHRDRATIKPKGSPRHRS